MKKIQISEGAVIDFPILEHFSSIIIPEPREMTDEQKEKFLWPVQTIIELAKKFEEVSSSFDGFHDNGWISETLDNQYEAHATIITEMCYYKGLTDYVDSAGWTTNREDVFLKDLKNWAEKHDYMEHHPDTKLSVTLQKTETL